MSFNNKNSSTYKKYKSNIIEIFIKGILLFALFFIFLYTVLKVFSILLDPKIFTTIFLVTLFIFLVINKLFNKKINRYLKRNYQTWGRGAGAEWVVGKTLEGLGEKYKLVDDIQNKRGNVDMVCVGPTGVFVVEVKSQKGFISWNNELLRNGRSGKKDFIKQVHGEIYYIKNSLKEKLGKEYSVQGILEYSNAKRDKQSINGQKKGIWIGGRGFAKWVILKKEIESLSDEEVESIYNCLCEVKENNN